MACFCVVRLTSHGGPKSETTRIKVTPRNLFSLHLALLRKPGGMQVLPFRYSLNDEVIKRLWPYLVQPILHYWGQVAPGGVAAETDFSERSATHTPPPHVGGYCCHWACRLFCRRRACGTHRYGHAAEFNVAGLEMEPLLVAIAP